MLFVAVCEKGSAGKFVGVHTRTLKKKTVCESFGRHHKSVRTGLHRILARHGPVRKPDAQKVVDDVHNPFRDDAEALAVSGLADRTDLVTPDGLRAHLHHFSPYRRKTGTESTQTGRPSIARNLAVAHRCRAPPPCSLPGQHRNLGVREKPNVADEMVELVPQIDRPPVAELET